MSSSETAIRVKNLSKRFQIYEKPQDRLKQIFLPRLQTLCNRPPTNYFKEFWALQDVSFEINKGTTVGIVGKNGSGKSTLLQMVCGTLSPTTGNIEVSGRIAALLELGSGFNPEFTGKENVYMNAAVLGLAAHEIESRYDEIVEFADIGDFIDQPVKTYSSGMMVRLAFSVIAHVDADILVIDEALSVGDVFFTQKCMRFLRRFMETGTVIFVSHDTGAVLNLCNHAILLSNGRIEQQGSPKEICAKYLASVYDGQSIKASASTAKKSQSKKIPQTGGRDMRAELINSTRYRNDIEIFHFKPEDEKRFGAGGARILNVELQDEDDNPIIWAIGGEFVCLKIYCSAEVDLHSAIVGFMVKDRLGQVVFADNTYLATMVKPVDIESGRQFKACFRFRMPTLPVGDYTISASVASGTQQDHIQHDWIHDAVAFKSHASSVCFGLIGVPMTEILLEKYE